MKEAYPRVKALGASIVGISADSLRSHESFALKLGGLPYPLASDAERQAIAAFGVLNDKSTGARRSVFVVDRAGTIVHANPAYKVSVPEHLAAVLSVLEEQAGARPR